MTAGSQAAVVREGEVVTGCSAQEASAVRGGRPWGGSWDGFGSEG
jgi:hypothetical protein